MPSSRAKARLAAPLSQTDYELLAAFRHELREFLHFSEKAARTSGLRPQQHQALLVIRGFPGREPVAVGAIAAKLKIRHHSAVELIARMQQKGLVVKAGDPDDGRRVLVRLTPRGERALAALSATHKAELARVGPALKEILTHLKAIS